MRCLCAEVIFSMPPPGIFRVSRSQRVRMHEYTLAARTYARVRAQGHSAHHGVRGPRITADSSAFKLPPPGIFSMHVYTHAGRHSGVHAQAAPGYAASRRGDDMGRYGTRGRSSAVTQNASATVEENTRVAMLLSTVHGYAPLMAPASKQRPTYVQRFVGGFL